MLTDKQKTMKHKTIETALKAVFLPLIAVATASIIVAIIMGLVNYNNW